MPQAQQRHISGQRQAPVPTGNDTTNSFRIHEISVASNDRALFLTADAAMTNSSPADVELNIADPSENSPFQRASNSPAEASVLSNDDYSAKTPLQGVSGIGVHPVVLSCKNLTYSIALPQEGNCFATCLKRWRGCRKVNTSESSVNTGVSRSHQKEILCFEGLELVFNPGDCVALMGSSGAGKSTLLNCLAGRVSEGLNGEVFLNDKPITRQLCKELSSFIQQEDVLFGYLTMEEHLYFQARLRLPKGSSAEEARRAANHLLESFGLAHIAKSFIGGPREGARGSISGGEKKRLCVATELLSNPSIIFADEPTSGLDSFMAKAVCDQLSLLATAGCTVVCTIHQPSSSCFAMFNKVLLIGEGRVLYYGDRLASVSWLEHLGCQTCGVDTNPAEFLMKATALQHLDPQAKTNRLKEWAEAWKVEGQQFLNNWEKQGRDSFMQRRSTFSSILGTVQGTVPLQSKESRAGSESEYQQLLVDDSSDNAVKINTAFMASQQVGNALSSIGAMRNTNKMERISAFTEALVLTKRALLLRRRDPSTSYIRFFVTLITALIPAFIYFRLGWSMSDAWNRVSACYQITLTQAIACLFAVANLFPQARPVAQREFESGVIRMWVYFFGVSTSDGLIFIIFPIIFHTVTFWIMGLADTAAKFFSSLCVLLLGVLSLQSYGYFISAVVHDEVVALAVTQVAQVLLSLFSGFMTQLDKLSIFWRIIAALSPFKYSLAAFSLTVLENEYFTDESGKQMLADDFLDATFGIKRDEFYADLGALAALIVLPRLLALFIMEYQARRTQENA